MRTIDFDTPSDRPDKQSWAEGQTENEKHPHGIQVVMMLAVGAMKSLWLPEPPVGKYRFSEISGETDESLYIEGRNGCWYACCNKPAYFRAQTGEVCAELRVADKCMFAVEGVGDRKVVYAEAINLSSGVFRNYRVDKNEL